MMIFLDRHDAGRQLADTLLHLKGTNDPVVLALPRGGVPVGLEIARALDAPFGLVLVRKLGAPGQEELAIGAVADGNPPEVVIDRDLTFQLRIGPAKLDQMKAAAWREIERRRHRYLGYGEPKELVGRTCIVVDDGIATGMTMLAALRATRRRNPGRLILAVPVAPAETMGRMQAEVDEAICLYSPAEFRAVGEFYARFPQLSDEEVIRSLAEANASFREKPLGRRFA